MVSLRFEPLPTKFDCWPLSLPATLTRSTRTPGTVFRVAQGSRDCGISASSSFVRVVEVPDCLVSTIGELPSMVTVSCTLAMPREKDRVTLWPVVTMTLRFTVEKPVSETARV